MVATREVEQQINQWEQWALLTASVYPHVAWLLHFICNDNSSEEKKEKKFCPFQWAEIMPENMADGPLTKAKRKKNTEDIS